MEPDREKVADADSVGCKPLEHPLPAALALAPGTAGWALALQRSIGNRAVGRVLARDFNGDVAAGRYDDAIRELDPVDDTGQDSSLRPLSPEQLDSLADAGRRVLHDQYARTVRNVERLQMDVEHFTVSQRLDYESNRARDGHTVMDIVRNLPQDRLDAVKADAALLDRIRGRLSTAAWTTVEKMIIWGLLGEGDVAHEYASNQYHTWTSLYRSGVIMFKNVRYIFDQSIPDATRTSFRQEVQAGITQHVNGRWKLRMGPGLANEHTGGDRPITYRVTEVTDSGYPITVHAGNGRSATGEAGGIWYVDSMVNDTQADREMYFAHELSHAMVGAPDEYPTDAVSNYDRDRAVTHDHSLMGNFYQDTDPATVEIKERHLQFLVPWVRGYFPARDVSIVR